MDRVSCRRGALLVLAIIFAGPREGDAVKLGSTRPKDGPAGPHGQFLRGIRTVATSRASPPQYLVEALGHFRNMDGNTGSVGLDAITFHHGSSFVSGEMVHPQTRDF